MLTSLEQMEHATWRANDILIVTAGDVRGDAIASAAALSEMLEALGKRVTTVCTEKIPKNLSFLRRTENFVQTIPSANDFIISVDVSKTQANQLSYNVQNNKLDIAITPKNGGTFSPDDVSFGTKKASYDLIITINTRDLEILGETYHQHTDLFQSLPLINIDHDPSNEAYGKINVVDIEKASTCQTLFAFAERNKAKAKDVMNEDVATALLTGLIAETNSFQTYDTTPEVLQVASQLYDYGADQQKIIRYLFKTRSLAALNLWGRVLARLQQSDDGKLAWSTLTAEDFQKSQAAYEDIEGVMKELLGNMPGAEILLALYPKDGKVFGKLHAPHNVDALKVAQQFQDPAGYADMAEFTAGTGDIKQAERDVVERIRKSLNTQGL